MKKQIQTLMEFSSGGMNIDRKETRVKEKNDYSDLDFFPKVIFSRKVNLDRDG